jgi:uncharacterized membrane protein
MVFVETRARVERTMQISPTRIGETGGGVMEGMRRAKRPVSIMAGPYGHPFHPILVTVPIGAWVASLVFDVASRLVEDERSLVVGSRWLIAIGVLGAAAAAMMGFLDLFGIPIGTVAFRTGLLHMGLNLTVTVAYLVNFLLRRSEASVPVGLVVLSAVSLAVLAVSGYLGGKLAFRYGVRVADEDAQADGYRITASGKE